MNLQFFSRGSARQFILNQKSKFYVSEKAEKGNQFPARLPFLAQNQLHLRQILNMKQGKEELSTLFQAFLETLKVNLNSNQVLFKTQQDYNKDLYSYIKREILSEQETLFGAESDFAKYAHYYFEKQGKKIRPLMIRLMTNCLLDKSRHSQTEFEKYERKSKKWAALIEILHIASLAHDDIIDDSPSRRGQVSQHLKYGKRTAVFSGNYIISKASREIFEFQSARLYQIYSIAMDNLATGQIIQALTKNKVAQQQTSLQPIMETYMNKTYYKTAALMANALRGVPLICEKKEEGNLQYELESFRTGQHFGIAFQIVDDILDYISTEAQMGKEQVADIRQGNVTAPVYLTLYHTKNVQKTTEEIVKELKRKNKSKKEALEIKKWVHEGKGIQLSYLLAYKHVETGLNHLRNLGVSEKQLGPWKYLGYKLLTRRK